jgi:hypothetical protein
MSLYDDIRRARDCLAEQPYQPNPPLPSEVQLLLREYREQGDLLHQIRSIVNEYRNGEHWSSVGIERIAALLDEVP